MISRRARVLLAVVAAVAALAVATQLALPAFAEQRLRDRLADVGEVTRVDLTARPAVKLLGGRVDRAVIALESADLQAAAEHAGDEKAGSATARVLDRVRHVDELRATADELRAGPLRAERVQVAKKGAAIRLTGALPLADLQRALPGVTVRVENSTPVLEITSSQLPLPGPLQIELAVVDGGVVARARGAAAMLVGTQPLLREPELEVTSLDATERNGRIQMTAAALLA
jgi:hypothetical protein